MKRLLWIFLTVVCTAFAQVQPVAVKPAEVANCCCGDSCACEQGCPMVATVPASPLPAERSAASVEIRRTRESAQRIAPRRQEFPSLSTVAPAPAGQTESDPPDAVPRFCRHCAFLI